MKNWITDENGWIWINGWINGWMDKWISPPLRPEEKVVPSERDDEIEPRHPAHRVTRYIAQ
jgi:hypothetical protein